MTTATSRGTVEQMLACLPEDGARFRTICASVSDWSGIFESEQQDSVWGILYDHLGEAGIELPAAVKKSVEQRLVREWLALLGARTALEEALSSLHTAGIRAVVLKGPVLAERLYPNPSVRSCSDIDLLVSLADLDQAAEALRAIGYRNNTGLLETYYRENHHHLPFYRPAATPIDLHFHAMVGFGTVVPAAVLLERARLHKRSAGQPAWVLAPEDEALYLLLHAARHLFLDPLWLYDLKLYLRRYPDLDWGRIADSARALRVVSALSLAFEVLERRLGVSVPARSCFEPCHRWLAAFGRLALAVTARQPPGSGRETAGRMLFRALLCDQPVKSAWALRTRLARFVRRRAQRCLSVIVPERWSV